jgi:vesicular inhibitory amino acid transporter
MMLGLEEAPVREDLPSSASSKSISGITLKRILTAITRVTLTSLTVAVSILAPDFSSMVAFLGSFSAFAICVIGPIAAKIALEGAWTVFDAIMLVLAVVMASWGTLVAFMV